MATVDVGAIVTRFQVQNAERELRRLERIEKQISKLEDRRIRLKIDAQGIRQAESSLNKLQKAAQRVAQGMRQIKAGVNQTFRGLASPITDSVRQFNAGRRAVLGFSDQITHMGQIAAATAFRLELLLAPLQAFAGLAAKEVIEIQHSLVLVGTQTDFTGKKLEDFRKNAGESIRRVTNEFAVGTKDMTEGLFNLVASLNFADSNIATKLLPTIAKFAVAGDTTASTVSELATILIASFKPEALVDGTKAMQFLEESLTQIFLAMKLGRGTFEQFVEQIGDFLRLGQISGSSLAELLSLFTVLTRTRPISEAATQVKRLSQTFIEPNFADEAAKFGVALTEINKAGKEVRRRPFLVMKELFDILKDLPEQKRVEAIAELFPNIRAELGALEFAEFADEILGLSDALGMITNITPEVQAAINDLNTTVKSKLKLIGNAFVNLGSLVEQDFEGRIKGALTLIQDGLLRLQEMPAATRQRLFQILTILSALPPVMLLVSVAIMGAGGLLSALATLASPAILGGAGALFLIFREELEMLAGVASKFNLATFDGLASFLAEIALALGILDFDQVARIFDALEIDSQMGLEYQELKEALQGIRETLEGGAQFVQEWTDAFDLFFGKIERREGVIGNLLQLFEFIAGGAGKIGSVLAGADVVPGRRTLDLTKTGVIDKAAGVFVASKILGALGQIKTGLMTVRAGVVNVAGGLTTPLRAPGLPAAGAAGAGGSLAAGGLAALVPGVAAASLAWMATDLPIVQRWISNAVRASGNISQVAAFEQAIENLADRLRPDAERDVNNAIFKALGIASEEAQKQTQIIGDLKEVAEANVRASGQIVNQIRQLLNLLASPRLFQPAMPNLPGPGGRVAFHTGGFIDMLKSEFVTSPLTTRMLEGVIGGPLTQNNLRQLAMANAGERQVNHTVTLMPGGSMDISLQAQGLGNFDLTARQKEELGWEITGLVAQRFREGLENNG